jgi:alpha-L-arabinofuranosidase
MNSRVVATDQAQPMAIALKGLGAGTHQVKTISLHGGSFEATNSITARESIKPVDGTVSFAGAASMHTVPALTIEVVGVPLQQRRHLVPFRHGRSSR